MSVVLALSTVTTAIRVHAKIFYWYAHRKALDAYHFLCKKKRYQSSQKAKETLKFIYNSILFTGNRKQIKGSSCQISVEESF